MTAKSVMHLKYASQSANFTSGFNSAGCICPIETSAQSLSSVLNSAGYSRTRDTCKQQPDESSHRCVLKQRGISRSPFLQEHHGSLWRIMARVIAPSKRTFPSTLPTLPNDNSSCTVRSNNSAQRRIALTRRHTR